MAKLDELYDRLLKDTRLKGVGATTPAMSERDLCLNVQAVVDDFVRDVLRPRYLREVTWGQVSSTRSMPRVELGGHNNYPDHIIWHKDLTVAIEVKRYTGQSSTLQQAIGQSLIYTQCYGFVLIFIADVTLEGRLAKSMYQPKLTTNEQTIQSDLWWLHNISIVCRHVHEKFTAAPSVI